MKQAPEQPLVQHDSIIVCDVCDWVNQIPPLRQGQRVRCARCHHALLTITPKLPERLLTLSGSALLMLTMALIFPFLGFSAKGTGQWITLPDTVITLLSHHFIFLGILITLFLLVLPIGFLISTSYIALAWTMKRPFPLQSMAARWLVAVQPWLMVDVFLVGILVALVKLHSLAQIETGLSFWAYCAFVILFIKVMSLVDRRMLWFRVASHSTPSQDIHQDMSSCNFCGTAVNSNSTYCPRCHHHLHKRRPDSLKRTIALLIAAIFMYIPANLFPIMNTEFLGQSMPSTILGGVILLWGMGSYPVAIIIFIASIVVPIAKILSLSWLCWQCYHPGNRAAHQKTILYHITEFIGRWSMIDVFVVAVLSTLVQLGNLMSIIPGSAAISFASVVILTMLAAMAFDPRLLWDSSEKLQEKSIE
ncbi:MAG: Intermembrane transport protein PqiA [Candidatus Celerinatantimonas neptuna]|nr:MAG: Intermembrane transport protein PqiA [Candidatus Celerinatantimonas neptuna]